MATNGHGAVPLQVPPGPPPGRPPMMGAPAGFGFPAGPPPAMPNFPPPLPPGWSEHTAPDGWTKYYYNSNTRESTYTRPPFPGLFGAAPPATATGSPSQSAPSEKKKKKEKPKNKVPIPGTTWTRVTTNEGNVFYFEKDSKRSEWSVPAEIEAEVEALEAEEQAAKEEAEREEKERLEKERLERIKERERIRLEVEEERKRKREAMDETGQERRKPKVAKIDKENGEAGEEEEAEYAPMDEEDEEAWMKAVAAEFAEADQAEAQEKEKDAEKIKEEEEAAAKKVFAVPEKVNVSLEEGRALFKALLIEKEISPFAPWDQSLPLFINDPRYVLLSSMKDRREVYEEYCRDVGRAKRLNKAPTATESKKADPEREYKALLREEVTSTRTRWEEFRKKFKKDRRFYHFGRDDREREKVFKVHLRELGERKRADAQRAEQDFFELLKEFSDITSSSIWSEVKRNLHSDARYDAVGSSSLREELFNTYVKNLASTSGKTETPEEAAERKLKERKAKEEASLRERQAKVQQHQQQVSKEVGKSRAGAGREEGERLFGSLLVDQIRDHEITWEQAVQLLSPNPRFNHPSLHPNDKHRLFNEHITRISSKRSNALHQLFATHAPRLDTPFDEVYPKIIDEPIVTRLALSPDELEDRFKAWRRTREAEARQEFDTMLGENSFVEFWGKMRKKTLDEAAKAVREDEMDEGEGMGDGGAADLTQLAKQIDLDEIKSVLRRDARYRQFDHIPDVREKWLREYLENIEAASGSRTIHNVNAQR
ncbi:hypothetical protein BCR39DRAFT_375721 [Naematelia encephala]|uniref:Transcription elongation regulator 1 n=1 Tax=Naematelia encephala TaxID=71784 RepID=A0A1Y2BCG9_9TREE|nr:hypothetical protein BCR39DRAFT_375721 [Naematelia encephala]